MSNSHDGIATPESDMKDRGFLILLIGPSGVGKNTILRDVLKHVPNFVQLPTATTRPPRPGEINGREHYFLSTNDFESLYRRGAFVEAQVIHGNQYGTLRSTLEQGIASGKDYIADIDPIGALTLKKHYHDYVILVFISPPSMDVLEARIRKRGPISSEELAVRLSRAQHELEFAHNCDYVVVNDDLSAAITTLRNIMLKERSLRVSTSNGDRLNRLLTAADDV